MKKLFLIITLTGSATFFSCKKQLDLTPFNAVSEKQAYVTQDDFTYAIRGAYQGFRDGSYWGGSDAGNFLSTPDVLADNLIRNQVGRGTQQTSFRWTYAANNAWTQGLFPAVYRVVSRANFILKNINNLPASAFKDNIRGEALAIRAIAHFDLLRVMGKAYAAATDADLGVPYVTTPDISALPARETVKKSYDLVVKDLTDAAAIISTSNGAGRIGKGGVYGMLSRVYLYMQQWDNTINAATSALAINPNLANTSTFGGIWLDAAGSDDPLSSEVIFEIKVPEQEAINAGVTYQQTGASGTKSEYVVDYAFFQQFSSTDVRKAAYIKTSIYNGVTYNNVWKYAGRASGSANRIDLKLLRNGEIYLNRAEAYYKRNSAGDEAKALADLNYLRQNRYTNFDPATATETGAALGDAIALQRRLELAFEGSRFFDLKRQQLPVQRSNYGDYANGGGTPAPVLTLPANDNRFALPVPQAEIDLNPNLKQNPGY